MKPLRSVFMSITRVPPLILIAAIVVLAGMVAWMVTTKISSGEQVYAEKQRELDAKYSAKATVVYAVKDIPEGQTIPSEALEERQIEQSKAPEDALTTATLGTGRVTKYGITQGQIVSQHDLQPQGISMTFDSRLKPGFRAVTFAVDNNSGVAGFISPESHIDIIGMVGSGADTKANPILSDVEVIAVGQSYQKNPGGAANATPASSVTVAVTPPDTTKLIKAVLASKLYLSLRNSNDHEPVATVDVTALYRSKTTAAVSNMNFPVPAPPNSGLMLGHHYDEGDEPTAPGPALASAPPPERQAHQIESWSAAKKDVISVPEK
jgi:pilus assembly protein CpaB